MTPLSKAQKNALRGLAHHLRASVQVGYQGLSVSVVSAIHIALLEHELIKVKMHEPDDKKETARLMAEKTGATLCGLIGHTVILYRPHPDEPKLSIP